jgi:hypothetical protein
MVFVVFLCLTTVSNERCWDCQILKKEFLLNEKISGPEDPSATEFGHSFQREGRHVFHQRYILIIKQRWATDSFL